MGLPSFKQGPALVRPQQHIGVGSILGHHIQEVGKQAGLLRAKGAAEKDLVVLQLSSTSARNQLG